MGQNNKMSVEKLVAFVKSSQKLITEEKTMTDKQLADFLSKVKLTEKLEPGVIEDLQSLGIGPQTMKALQKLGVESQGLSTSGMQKVLPDEPIPPPSALEQGKILDDVRNYVMNYDNDLPDFICTEVEHRQVAPRPGGKYGGRAGAEPSYQESDTITSRLSYFNHKEEKKLILVNSTPAQTSYEKLGGSTSNGDFGAMLRSLFERRAAAHFEWARWATLRGRLTMVFSFRVLQQNSDYTIGVKDLKLQIVTGYTGELFVDKETRQVTRLLTIAENIPSDFPVRQAQTRLDYDYTDIGGHPFLLPYRGEVQMAGGDVLTRNMLDFLHYKKYSADSAISYDIPADVSAIPDEKMQEKPAVDCKDPKNKTNPSCKN